jgi:hypothetical protein
MTGPARTDAPADSIMIYLFPADITTTRMLSPSERQLVLSRLASDAPDGEVRTEKTSARLIFKAFFNVNTMACTYMYICESESVFGIGVGWVS